MTGGQGLWTGPTTGVDRAYGQGPGQGWTGPVTGVDNDRGRQGCDRAYDRSGQGL